MKIYKLIKEYPSSAALGTEITSFTIEEDTYYQKLVNDYPEFWVIEEKEEKYYNIPIKWESYTRIRVRAINLGIAVEKALSDFLSTPDINYVEDSFEIDPIIKEETGEDFDIDKCLNNIF